MLAVRDQAEKRGCFDNPAANCPQGRSAKFLESGIHLLCLRIAAEFRIDLRGGAIGGGLVEIGRDDGFGDRAASVLRLRSINTFVLVP